MYVSTHTSLVLALLVLGALTAHCQRTEAPPPPGPARLTIQVDGAPSGPAYLIGQYAEQRYRADSSAIDANGQLVFQRAEPYPAGWYVVALPGNQAIQLLLDQNQTFSLHTRYDNLVGAMQVQGSLDNELLYQNLRFEAELQPQLNAAANQLQSAAPGSPAYQTAKDHQDQLVASRTAHLEQLFAAHPSSFFTAFKQAGQNPNLRQPRRPDGSLDTGRQVYFYRTEFWDNVDFNDLRLLRTPVVANKLQRYIKELTVQHADSINHAADFLLARVLNQPEYFKFFANWITLQYDNPTKSTLMDPEGVYVHMIQNYFTRERAFWADSMLVYGLQRRAGEMAASRVGQPAPNVTARDLNGQNRTLLDLKAPYLVVYMFNPDCEHCQAETPLLIQFYQQWKDRGVDVYSIAIDTDDAPWKAYAAQTGMPFISVHDPTNRAIYAKYYVDITPELYLIGPDRRIIAKNLKVAQLPTVIERHQRGEW